MLNNINLMGRLVRDPDLRYTQNNTPVASYTLAVDRGFKNADGKSEADFIQIVAWGKAGEFAKNYFHKGQLVCVEGRLTQRGWEDKHGNKRTSYEVVVRAQHFAEGKREYNSAPHPADSAPPPYAVPGGEDFAELGDDDAVPF